VTIKEESILKQFGEQVAAMLAREDQREKDKRREDALRATLRKADEARWDALDARLDRVQASVEDVSRDLAASLDTRVSDASKLRQQSDEIVARMQREAEVVALRLHAETESVAAKLGDVTIKTADILKTRQERQIIGRFFSRGMRIFLFLVVVVLLSALAFALFEKRDELAGHIATGIAAMGAAVAIVYALRGGKNNQASKEN
jgi:hypothetical protein